MKSPGLVLCRTKGVPELLPVCGVAAGARLRALQLGLARGGLHFRCTEQQNASGQ